MSFFKCHGYHQYRYITTPLADTNGDWWEQQLDFNNKCPRVLLEITCVSTTRGSRHALNSCQKSEEEQLAYLFTVQPNKSVLRGICKRKLYRQKWFKSPLLTR